MKHNNYDNPAEITIVRLDEDHFDLAYGEEDWSLIGTKDEVLEELSEHMDLMVLHPIYKRTN